MKALAVSTLLLTLPLTAFAAPDAAQTAAICQGRASCKIANTTDAGKSPAGAPLSVVEARLGLANKPDDAPPDGCRRDDGSSFDGGVEYWLLDGTTPPRHLLKLCNDGYGSSGVGEDEITIGSGMLVHMQSGGSAWRWDGTTTYSLSPWRALFARSCSFNNTMENTGTTTDIDYTARRARSLDKDSTTKDPEIGCPDWPESVSVRFSPEPTKGVYGAYDIVAPALGENLRIANGVAIGDCVPAMTTSGVNGFVVYGKPAAAGQAAEIKTVAVGFDTLLIQVFDPTASSPPAPTGGSWINLPHVEVWVGLNRENIRTRLPLDQLQQIGIDLGGGVHRGVGKAAPLPTVERWQAKDAAGRPVVVLRLHWPDQYALLNGVALVYSQAEAGKQARMVSTTGIANNRPLYLPGIVSLSDDASAAKSARCRVRNGQLAASD
jgi:hypothetical protein